MLMKKSIVALAAAAALVSGVAFAQEVKPVQKPVVSAPAQSAPAQMSDAEMDKITAGAGTDVVPAAQATFGLTTAAGAAGFTVPPAAAADGLAIANSQVSAH